MSTDLNMASASQPVTFRTETAYPLPSQKFMIPTTWKRYQLSQLINKALGLDKTKPIPFDFLVRGELLSTTLNEWCKENGVGEVSFKATMKRKSMFMYRDCRKKRSKSSISNRSCLLKRCQTFPMKIGFLQFHATFLGESEQLFTK